MRLTPRETDKLLLHLAGELAKERRSKGVKLNYAEAIALISSEVMERAREGRTVAELMHYGRTIVSADDVMPGVAEMISEVEVEATFPDGTKLVSIHDPIETTKCSSRVNIFSPMTISSSIQTANPSRLM